MLIGTERKLYTGKKMKKKILVTIAVVAVIVIIAAGYVGYSFLNSNPKTELSTKEQVRNDVINYIKTNHPQTAQYIGSFSWTGQDVTPAGLVGGQTYTYISGNWNVTMQYPVALPPGSTTTYTVTATFVEDAEQINWQGAWLTGNITETNFSFSA
jgi:hypothetical protein